MKVGKGGATMSTGTPRAQAAATPVRFRRNADRLTAGQLKHLRDAFRAVQPKSSDEPLRFDYVRPLTYEG